MDTEEYIRHRLKIIAGELDELKELADRISDEQLATDIDKASSAVWDAI